MKLLTAMDRFFTYAALKAEVWQGRYSWRLGQWLRKGVAGTHEVFLHMCLRMGWAIVDANLVRAAQLACPPAVPQYPAFSLVAEKPELWMSKLLCGVYVLNDGMEVKLTTLSWQQNPFEGTFAVARLLFDALCWVRELVEAYHLTGHPGYLKQAKALTRRWISECLYVERSSQVWSDHGTALRAIVLCQLWDACRANESAGSPLMHDLLSAIVRHAEKLAHTSSYRAEHDHGVTQAYALLAIGLLFPMLPKAHLWTALGHARLEVQMADNVSVEGQHREHSPYYHFFVFRQFYYAYRLAQAYGVVFSQDFTAYLQKMLTSGAHLLKPDGTLPALGDTSRTSPILVEQHELQEWPEDQVKEYLYSSTQGREGTPPGESSVLFQGAGMAFLRSGWGTTRPFRDERYLAFRVSTLHTSHVHRDVFSFDLYAYGDDLIVDSGGPYAYGHPLRETFFLSTAAHNTVVVDNQDQDIGEARVLHWSTSEEYDLLDAEHENYPGVTHRRTILFVRPDYFLILDRLVSEHHHCYSQLFHLQPDLQVMPQGFAITTQHRRRGPTVQIVPLLDEELGLRLHHGTLSPYQGWVCLGERRMIPNSAVEYQRTGTTVAFAILVVPEPPQHTIQVQGKIVSAGVPFQSETRIHVSLDERQDEILFTSRGQVTVKRVYNDCPV